MKKLLENSFDFSIRAIELIKYLDEEKKPFLLSERFLACATGIGVAIRIAQLADPKSYTEAFSYAVETEYLLDIMVKTGCLHKKQSEPITEDCRRLKDAVAELIQKSE